MSADEASPAGHARDSADLARFGYKQELKRSLGMFSSFAVAFSYISPSTGIFTLFALGLTTLGGVFIWTWPVVALGQFMSLFVIYGFDTTSTLAEETRDPRRAAPKAVLFSVVGAFIIGGVFLLGTLVAIPNLHKAIAGACGPAQIIEANLSSGFAALYLLVVSAAIFVCCLSIMAATIRLCFGMSRDHQLPISRPLARVAPNLHTPVWTCVAIAVLAAVPFLKYSGAGTIAIAAAGMIYLSYFLGNLVIMRARVRGWPRARAPFRLGRWGIA